MCQLLNYKVILMYLLAKSLVLMKIRPTELQISPFDVILLLHLRITTFNKFFEEQNVANPV